ncbi:MAG TPA: TonB-dependent receptor plug domain-containing protein, partial [Gemmatimonadales bacterium]|nr:TonB-dependent receptor plug domain-containing protein [Gemmatimonadales bacterium]
MTASPRPGQSVQRLAVLLAASLGSSPLLAQAPADTARAAAVRADSMSIGYGLRRAGDVAGAVTQVEPPGAGRGPVVSPEQLLRGIAGVQVVDNGEPGGSLAVLIRGRASVYAASDPLYVIDGMPVSVSAGSQLSGGRDALNVLNPADIESITVLR